MATLSRLWTPAGSSGHANSIEDSIKKKKIMAYLSLDCYWFTSFKNFAKNKKKIRDGDEVQFFCLLFCVGSFS
jgi:hypothetical protein